MLASLTSSVFARGLAVLVVFDVALAQGNSAERLAREYAEAVEAVNEAHARRPVATDERELAAKLAPGAVKLVAELAKAEGPEAAAALVTAAKAALDLDRIEDFEALRARLAALAPDAAKKLGFALSRPRFLAIGTDGVEPEGLAAIADVFDLVLDAYDDVFGLTNFSKVPGKKLRLRVRLVEKITKPPHFAPQFPWHSEIDFPVIDAKAFGSPTQAGQFLFYGLCHELGHVIAMWGDTKNEEDRHAWAHYTGVVIVEHLATAKKDAPALKDVRDVRWRSVEFERKQLAAKKVEPGGKDTEAVMARLLALHDAVGPKAVGEALNALDAEGKHQRVNKVRYYAMRDFKAALAATKAGRTKKKQIDAAFAGS